MITSAGVGSGIDIESIISQLMTLERQPLNQLNQKQSALDVQVSAYGTLKSAISDLASAAQEMGDSTKFGQFLAQSSDEEIFTATTTLGTTAENHDINVLTLAEPHRMTSSAYTTVDDPVGTGTYSFSSGSTSFDVTIDATNNSLTGLRDAINDAVDNDGIQASILNVDGGSRLVLTAKSSGTSNTISAPAMFNELNAAVDATLEVDGFMVTSDSNTITDVIPGLSLELKATGSAEVTTERDTEGLREIMDEFVTSYNSLRNKLEDLGKDELKGESLLRNIESGLRQNFFSMIDLGNGEETSVFNLGFTFDKTGVLSIDEGKLSDASTADIENFIKAFTNTDNGFGSRIENSLEVYTQVDGLIDGREDGLDRRSQLLDQQMERLEYRLEMAESRYRKQFTAMDAMVAQLQATSSYLTSQLGSLVDNN